jgi:hypothetical protein
MPIPNRKVRVFYHRKSAVNFRVGMEEYRLAHNLPPIYSPTVSITRNPKKGKRADKFMYTIVYFVFSAKQLRPELTINQTLVNAKSRRDAQEKFYDKTKDNSDVAFVNATKGHRIGRTKNFSFIVDWRKAIYRKPKTKERT